MRTLSELPYLYVHQLGPRSRTTVSGYLSILNAFHGFVTSRMKGNRLSEAVMQEWLRERALKWPLRVVENHACLVSRFLDWAVGKHYFSDNPLAKLKAKYGLRTTAPIVRALLTADFRLALKALRPAPRFASFLGPLMREHLIFIEGPSFAVPGSELVFDLFRFQPVRG